MAEIGLKGTSGRAVEAPDALQVGPMVLHELTEDAPLSRN